MQPHQLFDFTNCGRVHEPLRQGDVAIPSDWFHSFWGEDRKRLTSGHRHSALHRVTRWKSVVTRISVSQLPYRSHSVWEDLHHANDCPYPFAFPSAFQVSASGQSLEHTTSAVAVTAVAVTWIAGGTAWFIFLCTEWHSKRWKMCSQLWYCSSKDERS